MIFGSSIVRHVNSANIWRDAKISTKVNCYPGAGVNEIHEHANIRLNYAKKMPNVAIVHGGGNDLANGKSAPTIIKDLEKLGKELLNRGIKNIGFSAITPRKDLKSQVPILNKAILEMCSKNEQFHFINNSYITFKYDLSKDKVHLNFDGVWRLEKNISNFLKRVKVSNE